ncbi:acetyl-CoA carboxylase biotin carboxyl carrier protein [Cyanobium sp. Alchichica 3B3-8F6]|uniref:acetyl-CoA carboxylase biotin carboxyl carrier protein n=1 Tax=Synechococcales TaxID=1890424 RepID=UPI000B980857|nr:MULTISPECIES: acetyl-CoA carboxylase biotin carboxyl carrier protein [Synechococcales]MCP9881567.1 acetyl-CoA carboxylase biotin carboxyl carrier protein [Cyanobium sp. Alchichica 3B3-8F6]MCP9942699.1 acetyl-CoA carboxylase biotin carboxyl carrier protein [Cyanobium sp. ATX 6E8]
MQLNQDQLHQLLALLGDSDIQELKLEGDDFRLEVRRNLPGVAPAAVVQAAAAPPQAMSLPAAAPLPATPSAPPPPAAASRGDLLEVTAPMVATFYRAAAPGEPPFVEVGARIKVGQTVCILEAMKLMNELESEVGGEVVEILVENGTPVEFGQVLMRVRPA